MDNNNFALEEIYGDTPFKHKHTYVYARLYEPYSPNSLWPDAFQIAHVCTQCGRVGHIWFLDMPEDLGDAGLLPKYECDDFFQTGIIAHLRGDG